MKKIFVVTEGQSETNFVQRVMSPYFAGRCILIPNTVVTKIDNRRGKMYKGGVANYEQIRNTLRKTLSISSKSTDSYVTTKFETMLFSDITKLEETYFEYDLTALKECVKTQSNPELINNGAETAPSKRIIDCIGCFDKANVGVDVLEKIGIENIAAKCHHFSEWMKHIEERATRI